MQVVTDFIPKGDIGGGHKGLKTTNHSVTPCEVQGSGFTDGDHVSVTSRKNPHLSWSGTVNNVGGKWTTNLTCANTFDKKQDGPRDTDQVSVTVGTSAALLKVVTEGP